MNYVACLLSKYNFTGLANYNNPKQHYHFHRIIPELVDIVCRRSRITPQSKGYMINSLRIHQKSPAMVSTHLFIYLFFNYSLSMLNYPG